ncbi:MAG TPA: N-acetylmuramoyl-L-alanine amidase [Stackebrandtia sp.]|jgi:N-acetyl-anhydromuramyl-L-alanine amidase AmpD|uniref:N-acetylmuramoyl-L-alanine amidase n=1 Tax=Stackebrandtia sp. TaxID=2023065 RepID=UPI002D28EB3E|nr:N-acetylmuramoyl-L-alanine amidase [Stackebrandtia sp.]HZE39497.1 N-acetylmuramoyl-L-alanine amidase [Stackebrandtia sp.]
MAAATVLAVGGATAAVWTGYAYADTPTDRQAEFSSAAGEFSVPSSVLLGVSYMESRWIDHAGQSSTGAGYGPMHLTDAKAANASDRPSSEFDNTDPRGDARRPMKVPGGEGKAATGARYETAAEAAKLTGASTKSLRTNPFQNIRGGAALLAEYQKDLGIDSSDPADWYGAVAKYSGADDAASAARFADDVFATIHDGATMKTDDGTVRLKADAVKPHRDEVKSLDLKAEKKGKTECPSSLKCESVPAPYEKYGDNPGDYGNHDQANRPKDGLKITHIVIHDTETSYTNALKLVQDPTYLAWNYTVRSFDGHIAQHLQSKDVGWQAGNWSMNMHSIGVEHEGVAADGSWFTEEMYQSSAKLVKYLSKKFDIPMDRAHIIGHDNVPGLTPASIKTMHWDDGPFWDWAHYFDLMGAPLKAGDGKNGLVEVNPDYSKNTAEFTGCDAANPEGTCGENRPSAVVFVRSQPKADAPLLNDPGYQPDGTPSTNKVYDVGSRVGTGQKFVTAGQDGDWTAIWYLGQKGWVFNPKDNPSLIPATGHTITPKADGTKVYGGTYPEAAAYDGTGVPVQDLAALPYTLNKEQSYSSPGDKLTGQYFYAKTFEGPNKLVNGQRVFYQVQIGGRLMFVDANDVEIH